MNTIIPKSPDFLKKISELFVYDINGMLMKELLEFFQVKALETEQNFKEKSQRFTTLEGLPDFVRHMYPLDFI